MKNITQIRSNTPAFAVAAMVAITGFLATTQAQDKDKEAAPPAGKSETADSKIKTGDIVAVADGAGNFTKLCAAVKAAGLVESLQGEGPFTVFAPTDEAFSRLPEGTLENLLKPANKDKLTALLKYHVVPGKIMAADVKTTKIKTVNGQKLNIVAEDGKVTVDKAKVVMADVAASNGVIHAIDTVLMPE